jgi:uncharacterized protein (TIGR03000 family)
MFRTTFALGGTLLAAALGLLTPAPAQAFPPVRGGHAVVSSPRPVVGFAGRPAVRPGGFVYGGYRFGFVGGYHCMPYHRAGYHHGHYPYYGWGAYYPAYTPYAAYTPYPYNNYPDYGYNPYDSSYPSSGAATDSGVASAYQPSAAASPAQSESPAYVTVTVPANARVWCDGTATVSTGPVRQYVTAPLAPGRQSTIWVRARWTENGQERNQLQPVDVRAGGNFSVRFPAPTGAGG